MITLVSTPFSSGWPKTSIKRIVSLSAFTISPGRGREWPRQSKGISCWDYYKFHELYQGRVTDKRGTQLVIGLRRYKNRNGRWPESLDMIKDTSKPEYFVDPSNGGSFVYKLRKDTFILYSRGINNIDEGGQYNFKYDPQTGRRKIFQDDRLIWPPQSRKTQAQQIQAE